MSFTRNSSPPPTAPGAPGRAVWIAGLLLLSFALSGHAQEFAATPAPPPPLKVEEDPGYFAVREARTELQDGVYFLDARIEYRLSSDARRALQSGVPLTIRIEVERLKPRRLWFDSEEAALRQRYQLEYHALSERFTVQNLNSGDQASFSTLFAALDSLGRVEHLPLIDAALLDTDQRYYLRMRSVLDVEKLNGPLRLIAFWRRDWSLGSDWYKWQLLGD
jgi:uncharacterized protein DUF4390